MAETVTTSVFMSGRSQAVRIPKAFRLDAERVEIRKRGQEVVLKPIAREDQWASLKEAIAMAQANDLTFEIPQDDGFEGYPRMGFDESQEHFEERVREYERWREEQEKAWRASHEQ